MSDLRYIMDMGDDGDPGNDKYPRRPSHSGSARSPRSSSTTTKLVDNTQPEIDPRKTISRRRGPLSRSPRPTTAASVTTSTPTTDKEPPSRLPRFDRSSVGSTRQMDLTGYENYAAHSSSSSNMQPSSRSNMASRPVANTSGETSVPVKLTPITRRVSRAKKGVPVHVCDICKPSKTFTRAEHLRRHQLSHKPAAFQCPYRGCGKAFHRQDLLTRHTQRHEQEDGSGIDMRGSLSRRPSHPPVEGNPSSTGFLRATMASDGLTIAEDISGNPPYTSNVSSYSPSHRGSVSQNPMSPSGHSPRPHSAGPSHSHSQDSGYILSSTPHMSQINYHTSSIDGSHFPGKTYPEAFQPRRSPSFASYVGLEGLATQLPSLTIPDSDFVGHFCQESNWSSSASESSFSTPDRAMIRGHSPPSAGVAESALFFISPQFPSPQHRIYPPVTEYTTSYADETGCFEFSHPFPVRSPTPPTVMLSAQSAENLVTIGPTVPQSPAILSRQKASVASMSPYSDAAFLAAQVPSAAALSAIPRYLDAYWKRFDGHFPLVHRRSSEITADPILRAAMAALGSQFLSSKEDRINSQILYGFALQEAGHRTHWDLSVMQTILLCEYYGRFRGTRALVRPSEPFQSLYSRVSNPLTLNPYDLSSGTSQQRWDEWIIAESYRRLRATCFVLDVHTSMYHEHVISHPFITPNPSVPLTKSTQRLWSAHDSVEWEAIYSSDPPQLDSVCSTDGEINTDVVANAPPFDRTIYLALETTRLPRRSPASILDVSAGINTGPTKQICDLFSGFAVAQTYLALHHTPLRDLLAVSGDSWLFSRKILDPEDFQRRKANVKTWSSSVYAEVAFTFAAKALVIFLDTNDNATPDSQSLTGRNQPGEWNTSDISDYWALYVCALICWSLGHRAARDTTVRESSRGSGASTTSSARDMAEHEARQWLGMVASSSPESGMQNVRRRRESLGVVALVRKRLERENVGGKNKLLIDAVRVLKTLEEDPNRRRF
ncbi:hypothetical protein GGR50DRAFT_640079 [Xylaria sp. CBS 124048]|nr:hypothetical protein GGR50DRAFT_640079 [Xylaria sp. CBS 124048]